ncbi:hypothetical protein [Flavobacterium dankookense]|uniref:Uncharacterized protein n=1 Tax=Flavobacterium dankookense TaxID=706186 RepID=A0A4R6QEF2_9FLAO|nr:hypothetical protein [Flavobacterium dankookense]TDP60303.1 hypothetical protein BC748_1287 [Flavobacterium dankookense]
MFVIATILFTSCEKDLYEDSIKNSSRKLKIDKIRLSDIDNNTSFKILEKVKGLKSTFNQNKSNLNNQANRFTYNDDLDLYIDYDNGKAIQDGGNLYYTFPMFRKSEENLENILFIPKDNGLLDLYFIKYNIKPENFNNLTEIEKSNLNIQVYREAGYLLCFDVINRFLVYPNGCQETHSNGYTCQLEVVTEITTFCDWVSSGGGGTTSGSASAGNSGGSNIDGINVPGSGGSSGTNVNNDSSIPQIITSIIGLTPTQINFKDFITGLNTDQQYWWHAQENLDVRKEIEEYVNQHPNNLSVFFYVEQLIDYLILNPNISTSQVKNWFFKPSVGNFIYDDNINSQNSMNFQSLEEFEEFFNQINDNIGPAIEFVDGDTKIAKFKFVVNFFTDFNVEVQQKINPFSVENVSSNISGNTFSISYEQTTPNNASEITTISENLTKIKFSGNLNFNVFIQGLGTIHTYHLTFIVYVNPITGQPVSGQIIGLP